MKLNVGKISFENLSICIEQLETELNYTDLMNISDYILRQLQEQKRIEQEQAAEYFFKVNKQKQEEVKPATDRVTKIVSATGNNITLVLSLLDELKQIVTSANGTTTPRRVLDPLNYLAMFFRLPYLDELKPKKSLTEAERVENLKFLNKSFLEWLEIEISESDNINEIFKTTVIIDAIRNALAPAK